MMKTITIVTTLIVTMISFLLLAYLEVLSYQYAALLMIGVAAYVAIGGKIPKILLLLAGVTVFLIGVSLSRLDNFPLLLSALSKLFFALLIFYSIFRTLLDRQ